MKRLLAIVLSLLMVLSLAACGSDSPAGPGNMPPVPSEPQAPEAPAVIELTGDSYWVLESSEGDMREVPPEGDDLWTDLTLWADGTARIREIEGMWALVSGDDELNMTWEQGEDGSLFLYNGYNEEPYWSGAVTEDGIVLNRYGGTFCFRQEPMPDSAGMLYCPAELQGVWLQTGYEIEGDMGDSMPGRFNTLIFRTDWTEDGRVLLASSETGDYSGFVAGGRYYNRSLTQLDQPIYSGCGNEEWSVRIGEESPLNEHGYPAELETYVTLLDQNTLLQQQYFSFDNGQIPGVSYQTFRRFLPKAPYGLEAENLEGGDYELFAYIDADGVLRDEHPDYSDFYLHLDPAAYGWFFSADTHAGDEYTGGGSYWALGDGGTLLMCGEEDWYAGAVDCYNQLSEIRLWDNMGGILCLEHVAGSGGENYGGEGEGYADTMTDLEGNAFAAPADAVLVWYGDAYLDMDWYQSNENVPFYALADGPDTRAFLISCVWDDTTVWVENDGFEVARFEPMMAGESMIIQLGYPEYGGPCLWFEFGDEEFFIELNQTSLPLDMWTYLTVSDS